MSAFFTVFITVFLAELGDKTQLATMLFATEGGSKHPWMIFVASALALTLSSAIAVLLGSFASKYLAGVPLKLMAGMGFVVIGGLMVADYWKAS